MSRGIYIDINTATIANVSAHAATLGNEVNSLQGELRAAQGELSESLTSLEDYVHMCFEKAVPIKRLDTQKDTVEKVVSLLGRASELAEEASRGLVNEADALQLALDAMTGAASCASVISVVLSAVNGETDCGDGWVNVGTWVKKPSRTYGEGDLWSVEAYPQGKYFDRNIWPNGYTRGDGCGVASTATALSSLGIQALPKDICQVNQGATRNPVMMSWGNVAKTYGLTCSSESNLASKGWSQEQYASKIDEALNNYLNNPSGCSAPIIGFSKGYIGGAYHYVVVYGKNADGSYQIVDSSGNNMTTFNLVSGNYGMDRTNKVFNANLNQIVQFKR